MKNIVSLATIISTIMFCVGCTSTKTVVLNVEKPAQIILPKTVENIAIVNNAIPQPYNIGHIDYKYTKKGDKLKEEVSVPDDSVCSIFTETLYENLSNLDMFNKISLYEYPLRNDLEFADIPLIDSTSLKELFNTLDADAIISLDRFIVNTTYNEEPYDIGVKAKLLDLKMETVFRIYSKERDQISFPFYMSDSIYWDALYTTDNKRLVSLDSIPKREDAIKQAAGYAAEKVAKAFSSSWTEKVRIYYGDSKEANKMVDADNWQKALSIWEKAFNEESKIKKKARFANNIALAYETTDNIREALRWAQTAIQLFSESAETNVDSNNLTMAQLYYDELMERYNDFRIFNTRY